MSLNPLPFREVKRKLLATGFEEKGQKGSHVKFFKVVDEGTRTATVPHHKEITIGTLRSILRQAGISPDDFELL